MKPAWALAWLLSLLSLFVRLSNGMTMASRPVALVTGSTDGIGLTTAKNLAAKGFRVILHGRDAARIESARRTVQSFVNGEMPSIQSVEADLSTTHGTKKLANAVASLCGSDGLSVLVNNAGVYAQERIITQEGLELTFAVNVLSPFMLTSLLLPTLLNHPKKTSRIVIASSISQCHSVRDWSDMHYARRPYSAHGAYSESKLLDAMLTVECAQRLQQAGFGTDRITCNCLDPGTVNTKMLLAGWGPIGIDVDDALDETWLCTSDEVQHTTGKYFRWRTPSRSDYDPTARSKMWQMLSGLDPEAAKMWEFQWPTT